MKICLSPRLREAAAFVSPGSVAVDVGADHAYLPIWLLQNGVCPHVYATENRPAPFHHAAMNARRFGVSDKLTLYQCDGLTQCPPAAVNTVMLCGMGGETILRILQNSPWALTKSLILQPQSKREVLLHWLEAQGVRLVDATLAQDRGHFYEVWLYARGKGFPTPEARLLEKRDPLLRPWLEARLCRLNRQLAGLASAKTSRAAAWETAALERENLLAIWTKI